MAQVTAQIVIAQAGNPAPGGYSSGSRDDIVVGSAVTATNLDDTSATWHRWTVSPYYPAGTLGGLGVTGDGTATCSFEPDVEGDIALTLEVAGLPLPGGGANYARQTVMLGIRAVLAGYAPGMPLPHPLEGGRGQSSAVDPAVGADGRIDEALYALKQGLSVAGAGTPYASTPANVGSSGSAGASSDYARGDHAHRGVASLAKNGSAALYGAVTLTGGSNVTLTQAGNNIEIAAAGGGGRPTPPASAVVVLRLDDVAGTTSVANSGTGTAFTLGTITGTVVFGSPTPIGNGLFVQNTSYIRGAGSALTYQATTQNMTAMCWVKFGKGTTLGSGGDKATLFGKEGTAGATFALSVLQDTGQLQASIETASGGATNTTGGYVGTDWSLVAMTYDGTTVKTYVNGVQVGSGVANTGNLVWDNTKSWQVGNNANNALFTLRECWFHNAVLTLAEIQAIYNTGAFNGAVGVLPTRGVVASLEWSATAGVFTTVSSLNIAGRVAYDYGSGTNSLKVTLTNAVTNGIPHAHADPDWVSTFHVDAVPTMVSSTEIRIDFRNKGDAQIAPADGAGVLTVIGDL